MKLHYFKIYCLCCLFFLSSVQAQRPGGTWKDYLPYTHAFRVAEVGNNIFCATDGGMFSFNKDDNYCCQKYSKVTGLSDVDICGIGYSEQNNTLIIAYMNGNIDLVMNDSVKNIPDIKMEIMTGDKKINKILLVDDIAYLATGFGVVAVDISRKEIKDTYKFGESGSQIMVNDITFDGKYLYAATAQGIYKANINSPNLVDYNYWSRLVNVPITDFEYKFITYHNNKILASYDNPLKPYDHDIIIIEEDENWELWDKDRAGPYTYFGTHNNYLIAVSMPFCAVYNESEELVERFDSKHLKHAIYDKDHILWAADPEKGLIKYSSQGVEEIAPDGPAYKDVGAMLFENGYLWVSSGNESNLFDHKGIYSYFNSRWINYNKNTIPELGSVLCISEIEIDPGDPEHVFGGSYGFGVVELKNGQLIEIYDEDDGVLRNIEGFNETVRITGMSFDRDNNLWVATSEVENPVFVFRSEERIWEDIEFDNDVFGFTTRTGKILVTSFNQIWLLLTRNGIFIFRENSDGSIDERLITIRNQEGELIDRVFSLAEDMEGDIWVGTNKGPVVYYSPANVFEEDEVIGYQIKIPRNDGTPYADILLENEVITAIAIDGANRKWLGTENSGVFLMSDDGKEEILSFNEDDDPLFSNTIISIAIDHESGEVFFGTDQGILSYMGQATEGSDDFDKVYVFPNPVRENYHGDITVTGLMTNTNVKITDISGNIVFETTSLGGQAIWDGRNFSGKRVHTGIYLVFCSSEDGSKTHITKLLFIH
jgi:ligand-binding sensor domain-containing protein